jgi:Flp pilus assembly protein protease CpaA
MALLHSLFFLVVTAFVIGTVAVGGLAVRAAPAGIIVVKKHNKKLLIYIFADFWRSAAPDLILSSPKGPGSAEQRLSLLPGWPK